MNEELREAASVSVFRDSEPRTKNQEPRTPRSGMNSPHQIHDAKSLEMHRRVAERFRKDPGGVARFGLSNIKRWRDRGVDCEDFYTWENLLEGTSDRVIEVLLSPLEQAVRLRQSSPFAGLIPEDERKTILMSSE